MRRVIREVVIALARDAGRDPVLPYSIDFGPPLSVERAQPRVAGRDGEGEGRDDGAAAASVRGAP